MWKVMFSAWWVLATQSALHEGRTELEFGPGTILVYENETLSNQESSQFVLRIARFDPDIVFEWESESHQGTVHILSNAVEEANGWTPAGLFDAGVDVVSKDTMSKWLSRRIYRGLSEKGREQIKVNRMGVKLEVVGRGSASVVFNGGEAVLPVLELSDSRGGAWRIHDDPSNPLVIEYSNRYYRETLRRVATDQNGSLRWFRQVPPVQ
jgi:hypothetical protein